MEDMNEKEIIDVAIRTYYNLQRIKKYEQGEKPEPECQLKNIQELEN